MQIGSIHIFTRPRDYLLHRIYMRHISSCTFSRNRSPTCICKKIQHFGFRNIEVPNCIVYEVPILRLFRKHPYMLERSKTEAKPKFHFLIFIVDKPLIGHSIFLYPNTFVITVLGCLPFFLLESGIGCVLPLFLGQRLTPYCLWFGTSDNVFTKTF